MRARRAGFVVGTCAALAAGCGRSEGPDSRRSSESGTVEPPLPSPARLEERFILEHAGERCAIRVEGKRDASLRLAKDFACPRDLASGERIVMTGTVCMRESATDGARNVPVVCPSPLMRAERDLRSGALDQASPAEEADLP